MSWGKLDDGLHSHPKALDAGLEAMGLWSLALSHSAHYLTDGHISRGVVARLAAERGPELAARLVDAGLWELHTADGWVFHDFHDYNPSRADVLAEREAKRAGGRRGAANRWGSSRSNGITHNSSHGISNGSRHADVIGSGDAPDPDPDPDRDQDHAQAREEVSTGVRKLPKSEPKVMGPFWRETYAQAVRDSTGDAAWSFDERQLGALTKIVERRCEDRARIVEWVAEKARAFVAATRDSGQFYASWQPRGLARWLDAGSPASSARSPPARRGAPLQPYSQPRLRTTPAPDPTKSTFRDELDDMVDEVEREKRRAIS